MIYNDITLCLILMAPWVILFTLLAFEDILVDLLKLLGVREWIEKYDCYFEGVVMLALSDSIVAGGFGFSIGIIFSTISASLGYDTHLIEITDGRHSIFMGLIFSSVPLIIRSIEFLVCLAKGWELSYFPTLVSTLAFILISNILNLPTRDSLHDFYPTILLSGSYVVFTIAFLLLDYHLEKEGKER